MTISATMFGIVPTTIAAEPKPSGGNHDAHHSLAERQQCPRPALARRRRTGLFCRRGPRRRVSRRQCEWGAIERVQALGGGKIIGLDTTTRTGALMVRKESKIETLNELRNVPIAVTWHAG